MRFVFVCKDYLEKNLGVFTKILLDRVFLLGRTVESYKLNITTRKWHFLEHNGIVASHPTPEPVDAGVCLLVRRAAADSFVGRTGM
jgi:hypothetical protein